MKTKFAIIGGGVAGLCAAIRLAELGEEPLVIEGGSYPAHKICGEFLSPECLSFLQNWNIHPISIHQAIVRTPQKDLIFPFFSPAGSLSHIQLDPALVHHATTKRVKIKTNTQVTSFLPKKHTNDTYLIHLSNHETVETSNVIIAAGRFQNFLTSNRCPPPMNYVGFKAHFENIPLEAESLEMFSFPGAYLGISPIENHKFNVACLARLKKTEGLDPQLFIQSLMDQHPRLHSLLSEGKNLFDYWMTASLPSFGVKQTPHWPDAYFIGDAAVTIPPASGNGLSMAIFGGRLAAEYSVKREAQAFKTMWMERCRLQVFWAKILHQLMFHPSYSNPLLSLSAYFPYIANKIFEFTRQPT